MDYVSQSNPIFNEEISAKKGSSAENHLETKTKTLDVAQIEKELSNSLKLLQTGLSNLDIEAAHFLNPPRLKHSFKLNEKCSLTFDSKVPAEVLKKNSAHFSRNSSTITASKQTNDSSYQKELSTTSRIKNVTIPPDLTFSFYSSTEEIVPLANFVSQKSQVKSEPHLDIVYDSFHSNDDIQLTLDEILSRSADSIFSKKCELSPEVNGNLEHSELIIVEKKNAMHLNAEKRKCKYFDEEKRKSNQLEEKSEALVEMDDLVESLSKIKSALDDLDKEAAHIINPSGIEICGELLKNR